MKQTILCGSLFIMASLVFIVVAIVLPTLPGRLDELLLTNDEYCDLSVPQREEHQPVESDVDQHDVRISRDEVSGRFNDDFGYAADEELEQSEEGCGDSDDTQTTTLLSNTRCPSQSFANDTIAQRTSIYLQQSVDSLLWKFALNLWYSDDTNTTNGGDNSTLSSASAENNETASASTCPLQPQKEEYRSNKQTLHPMCQHYRTFRSRLYIERLILPWNWYFRCSFRVEGLSIRAATTSKANGSELFTPSSSVEEEEEDQVLIDNSALSTWEMTTSLQHIWNNVQFIMSALSSYNNNAICVNPIHHKHLSNDDQYNSQHLPPSMNIQSIDISFQSWSRPVISVNVDGVVLNIIIQKGGFPIHLHLHSNGKEGEGNRLECEQHCNDNVASLDDNGGLAIFVGDMTIHEALLLLPKPPEVEGLYPRIGVVNISNATVGLYDIQKHRQHKHRSEKELDQILKRRGVEKELNLLMEVKLPNEFFRPVTNLTIGK